MIKIGKRQKMIVDRFTSVGAYLTEVEKEGEELEDISILLPNNELEERELQEGDEVEVLIYMDSEDRPVATFRKTEALVGTLAKLEVTDVNPKLGAFMDWGLKKELLLPRGQQEIPVEVGKKYLVGIYEDSKGRLSATMKIYKFLLPSTSIKKNDIVSGTVYRIEPNIGVFVAVEDRYFGLIPKIEYFKDYKVGDEIEARVIRVREDGKIDLTPRERAYIQIDEDAELILGKMRLLGDSFGFTDKSSPEEIIDYFNMSKKAFKRAMGNLLKNGKVEKNEKGYYRIVKKTK
ncbi:MAG: S1 RNA-binding domain-containing protein [Fusobacterium sp.]|jgi:predicted RNA-binding protein (virulence factor B family)|uniref:CvfB family protein n=1 Tax=Fusobacterium sp. TaxID=68766 RepID=UPI0025F47BCA|nr:S1-like domain-containing RNA-binding protein [Fusobacterium sp.]MDY3059866.1 S1-like domain-containing RNA-binding protein [Fusobacterium sp.]